MEECNELKQCIKKLNELNKAREEVLSQLSDQIGRYYEYLRENNKPPDNLYNPVKHGFQLLLDDCELRTDTIIQVYEIIERSKTSYHLMKKTEDNKESTSS